MFKVNDKVNTVHILYGRETHACTAVVTKVTRCFVWILNEHGNTDKFRSDGSPTWAGSHYALRPV